MTEQSRASVSHAATGLALSHTTHSCEKKRSPKAFPPEIATRQPIQFRSPGLSLRPAARAPLASPQQGPCPSPPMAARGHRKRASGPPTVCPLLPFRHDTIAQIPPKSNRRARYLLQETVKRPQKTTSQQTNVHFIVVFAGTVAVMPRAIWASRKVVPLTAFATHFSATFHGLAPSPRYTFQAASASAAGGVHRSTAAADSFFTSAATVAPVFASPLSNCRSDPEYTPSGYLPPPRSPCRIRWDGPVRQLDTAVRVRAYRSHL